MKKTEITQGISHVETILLFLKVVMAPVDLATPVVTLVTASVV